MVKLEHVLRWVCPSCNTENIAQMWPAELNAEEKFEARMKLGIGIEEEGALFTAPSFVECSSCKTEFESELEHVSDDE